MKMTECICKSCGISFMKPTKEYTRKIKIGTPFYCSMKCAAKDKDFSHLKEFHGKYNNNISPGSFKDKYSVVREHLARAKRRSNVGRHEPSDLDLEYLLEVWESQKGVCPISGLQMIPVFREGKALEQSHRPNAASLDRIDCSRGYIKGNVRFTTAIANMARNCWDDATLIAFCKSVAAHQ